MQKRLSTLLFQIGFSVMLILSQGLYAQSDAIAQFDHQQDIGNPKLKGSATYDAGTQTYTLSGAGSNMWLGTDQFHFVWKKIKGDFILRATVHFIGKGVNPHRKIGIIARDSLTATSRYADACVHGVELTSLQYRSTDGDSTRQIVLQEFNPTEIEFQRTGNTFIFSAATYGENYKSVSKEIQLNDEVYVGLFLCSHESDIIEKAVFSNVRIVIPAPDDFVPYRDYIGSNLEVMDVATGVRTIVHTASNSLQAPNWTKDGKSLIYNEEGLLKKYELSTGAISTVNTGRAKENNNDHVISFDGTKIGISSHTGTNHVSTIYTLPIGGSDTPVQMTSPDSGASYLHSWSPDGKLLIFTGQRNGLFNIYSVDVATKKETRLTDTPTLDDGPEYSPDGQYIYFNSVRTGTMQIWRMKPDGRDQEQITFDEFNDWFPHISPDGKWIVYISFPKDINPSDHPFYKKVYLRLMPASGGVPKTIAYIYGGQGTINTPSWSPDSKRIAFISNTKIP